MTRVPRWRIAAGVAVLVVLLILAAVFTPIYIRNLELQNYVSAITQSVANQTKSDDALRSAVLDRAGELSLPVLADNVHIIRSKEGKEGTRERIRIDVRYFVTVTLPGYTVNLHFYPGAGSR